MIKLLVKKKKSRTGVPFLFCSPPCFELTGNRFSVSWGEQYCAVPPWLSSRSVTGVYIGTEQQSSTQNNIIEQSTKIVCFMLFIWHSTFFLLNFVFQMQILFACISSSIKQGSFGLSLYQYQAIFNKIVQITSLFYLGCMVVIGLANHVV